MASNIEPARQNTTASGRIFITRPIVPLTIVSSHQIQEGDLIRVRGTARHDGQTNLARLLVSATLFDEAGQVSGFRVQRIERPLAPGESIEIDILLTPLLAGTMRHIAYAEGELAQ